MRRPGVFCYGNVFIKYQSMLRRKEGGQEMSRNEDTALTLKSKLLLKKLALTTTTFLLPFLPLAISFIVMMAKKAEVHDIVEAAVLSIFEIGFPLNPILIYLLDAKMKQSVNKMLGINIIEMKTPVLKNNIMQLYLPIAPANSQQSPIKTVILPHSIILRE